MIGGYSIKRQEFGSEMIFLQKESSKDRLFLKRFGLYLFLIRYRLYRKSLSGARRAFFYFVQIRIRFVRFLKARFSRFFFVFTWKLWVRSVSGLDHIPENSPVIIVSNHTSYFDFFILASVLKERAVFVASKKIKENPLLAFIVKHDTLLYIDKDNPGYSFFKKIYFFLKIGKNIVIYPEGTRSRSGKMLLPKPGFVKLAVKSGVPVVPVAMRGTYEILRPNKRIPKLKKCDVVFGSPIYINNDCHIFRDLYFSGSDQRLDKSCFQEAAIRIMDQIRLMAGTQWDQPIPEIRILTNGEESSLSDSGVL